MVKVSSPMGEDYWKNFQLHNEDTEFLYNHLLELETPLTSRELVEALIGERIRKQTVDLERQRTAGGDLYQPNGIYEIGQTLIFPVHDWKHGKVTAVRSGRNPELRDFQVIDVIFEDGEQQQFAANMPLHKLNAPPKIVDETAFLDRQAVMNAYEPLLMEALEENLQSHSDIVRIAGRWFPRALLLDVNMGHLNLAEAVLEVANGGPLPTSALVEQIEQGFQIEADADAWRRVAGRRIVGDHRDVLGEDRLAF